MDDIVRNSQKLFEILEAYNNYPLAAKRHWAEAEKKRIKGDIEEKQLLDAIHNRFGED